MNERELIDKLEMIVDSFKDIRDEPKGSYSDDDLRSKAKYLYLKLHLIDEPWPKRT